MEINDLVNKKEAAKICGFDKVHNLYYYLQDYKLVPRPAEYKVAGYTVYDRHEILSWWNSVKQYQSKQKEERLCKKQSRKKLTTKKSAE